MFGAWVYNLFMPTRNIVKEYGEGQYYHVYNRGVAKADIFLDDDDYRYMLSLFKKYLSGKESLDNYGRAIPNYKNELDLVAYCLMPNHYHMLVYLKDKEGLMRFMKSVMTSYSMYFNKRHGRLGSLFQNHFLASRITDEAYFWHITRYIHLNPLDIGKDYKNYSYSSLGYFIGDKHADWLHETHIVETTKEREDYQNFLQDYQEVHDNLDNIKHQLANSTELE